MVSEKEWLPLPPETAASTRSVWEKYFDGAVGAHADEISPLRRRLTELMTNRVGIFRTEVELGGAVEEIEQIREQYRNLPAAFSREPYNFGFLEHLELGYLIELSAIIAMGAQRRTESTKTSLRTRLPGFVGALDAFS